MFSVIHVMVILSAISQVTGHQDSAVNLHLTEINHSFKDSNVNIMEDRWFERGIKESIYVKLERLSLNRGGDITHLKCSTEFPPQTA